MVDCELESDGSACRVTGDMRAPDTEMIEEPSGIGRVLSEAHRRGAIRTVGELPLAISD
jgi:hypothetical protein